MSRQVKRRDDSEREGPGFANEEKGPVRMDRLEVRTDLKIRSHSFL